MLTGDEEEDEDGEPPELVTGVMRARVRVRVSVRVRVRVRVRVGAQVLSLGRPLEGWQVASKRLGPLTRRRGSALALGCGRGGRVALPLARAAAVSTGLSVRGEEQEAREAEQDRREEAHGGEA